MEGSLNRASNATTAMVVRQFVSSRIEHELLAQVFELVCGKRKASEGAHSIDSGVEQTQRTDADQELSEAHIAGRRVA